MFIVEFTFVQREGGLLRYYYERYGEPCFALSPEGPMVGLMFDWTEEDRPETDGLFSPSGVEVSRYLRGERELPIRVLVDVREDFLMILSEATSD